MLIGAKLVKTGDLGIGGNLYGGRFLEMMAEQAAIYAMKITGEKHLLGYRFSEVILSRPVREGEILDFHGENPTFRTSSVTFELIARVGEEVALRGQCTFVAVDAEGRKKTLGPRP